MRVLIACEESQVVCKAFRDRGHEAYSCDIQEPSGGHPEWHILGDVLRIINPRFYKEFGGIKFQTMDGVQHIVDRWDMIIAHPPCTYLSNVATLSFPNRGELGLHHKYHIKSISALSLLPKYALLAILSAISL